MKLILNCSFEEQAFKIGNHFTINKIFYDNIFSSFPYTQYITKITFKGRLKPGGAVQKRTIYFSETINDMD